MDLHERLRWARKRRGFKSAKDAAEYLGVPHQTYAGHESGSRNPKAGSIQHYARVFRVDALWLEKGIGESDLSALRPKAIVEIVGRIGHDRQGSVVSEKLGDVEMPWGIDEAWEALLVDGAKLQPVYREGSLLLYQPMYHDLAALIGHVCVVELVSGQRFVKTLRRGDTPDRWSLESSLGASLTNQLVRWASPIQIIKVARTL